MYSGSASTETSTTPTSPVAGLPQEVVEVIITNLICDKRSLRACSLTCHSWCIAAFPHLSKSHPYHEYLPVGPKIIVVQSPPVHAQPWAASVGQEAPDHSWPHEFSPGEFRCFILPYFSALTNVQEFWIDHSDIPKFMLRLLQYFSHFLPIVRSLALRSPKGTRRQIIYFIGLFQHLEYLKLLYQGVAF